MSQIQISNFTFKFKNDLKKLNQWPALEHIWNLLDKKNRLCWISGGAVRDLLLSRIPLDFDLTTDATEEEILEIFPQALLLGQKFGVYKIPINGDFFDLTVFRQEDGYLDGRRPQFIQRSTPYADAQRRDFTINGLFWDLKNEVLVDYVEGFNDLQNRTLRCIGVPSRRFEEDFLRILRLIRFVYTLNFKSDFDSYQAGLSHAESLKYISGERISAEILKLTNFSSRLNFYSDPLFVSIMKHNDLSLLSVEEKLTKLAKTEIIEKLILPHRIWIELFFLLGINSDNLKKLQSRLKISNDSKKWLIKFLEIYNLAESQKDFVSFCLLIDKSQDYLVVIQFLGELGIIDDQLSKKIFETCRKYPQPLVKASDLLHIVPHAQLSKVLGQAREWQIRNEINDSRTVIEYIKKLF